MMTHWLNLRNLAIEERAAVALFALASFMLTVVWPAVDAVTGR